MEEITDIIYKARNEGDQKPTMIKEIIHIKGNYGITRVELIHYYYHKDKIRFR